MTGQAKRKSKASGSDEVSELQRTIRRLRKQLRESATALTERTTALNAAFDQQTATTEVLQVINSSPGDLGPVFDAMLERATRLCSAPYGQLAIYDGEVFRFVAAHGEAEFARNLRRDPHPPSDGITWLRILGGENVVHVPDASETDLYRTGHLRTREFVDNGGGRALLSVALRKDETLLGVLTIYRQEPQPFTDKQIALLENFAAQAVIAMEYARLLTETREALEQQTATAEVLQIINSSPGDLAPVFDALLEKAMQLCEATFGGLTAFDDERFHTLAVRGLPRGAAEAFREPWIAGPGSYHEDLVQGKQLVHTDFGVADPARQAHRQSRVIMEIGKARTGLIIALRKDERLIGSLFFYRQEVRPFSDKQIALLQNFAAQAVIAMENARLLTETREALDQQTATAEVLGVINSSLGDLAPVFDAMLDKAAQLCRADFGAIFAYDGQQLKASALRGTTEAYAEFLLKNPVQVSPANMHGKLMSGEPYIHIPDVSVAPPYLAGDAMQRAFVDLGCGRTVLGVPLRKDKAFLGELAIYRCEVRPFSNKQIGLLQNFAAQAVIAIENARLITETREALEQQTATAEVLGVINSSPGDLAPVFEAMIERAMRLCEASFGIMFTVDGDHARIVATRNVPEPLSEYLISHPPEIGPDTLFGRAVRQRKLLHAPDALASEPYRAGVPLAVKTAELGNVRALLSWLRCLKMKRSSVSSQFFGMKLGPFQKSRSPYSKISRRKPSSPSRTRGCSVNYASELEICNNRSNTRPRRRMY